jgi:hypothetical protein
MRSRLIPLDNQPTGPMFLFMSNPSASHPKRGRDILMVGI